MRRPAAGPADPPDEVLGDAAAVFGLLSSAMRLYIVWALAQGECDVTGLAERVGGSLSTVSQHLAKLKLAGLVHARREGRRQVYLVNDPVLISVVQLLVTQRSIHGGSALVRLRGAGGPVA